MEVHVLFLANSRSISGVIIRLTKGYTPIYEYICQYITVFDSIGPYFTRLGSYRPTAQLGKE